MLYSIVREALVTSVMWFPVSLYVSQESTVPIRSSPAFARSRTSSGRVRWSLIGSALSSSHSAFVAEK